MNSDDSEFYKLAAEELAHNPNTGLLIKCGVIKSGDDQKARLLYIETRVKEMKKEVEKLQLLETAKVKAELTEKKEAKKREEAYRQAVSYEAREKRDIAEIEKIKKEGSIFDKLSLFLTGTFKKRIIWKIIIFIFILTEEEAFSQFPQIAQHFFSFCFFCYVVAKYTHVKSKLWFFRWSLLFHTITSIIVISQFWVFHYTKSNNIFIFLFSKFSLDKIFF